MNEEHPDLQMLDRHANQLAEYFDTVQIFCTRHDPAGADGTVGVHRGAGNWYARYGQAKEWVLKCDERTRLNVAQNE